MSEIIHSVDSLRSETEVLLTSAQDASILVSDALAAGATDLAAVRAWLKVHSSEGTSNRSLLRECLGKSMAAGRRMAALLGVSVDDDE